MTREGFTAGSGRPTYPGMISGAESVGTQTRPADPKGKLMSGSETIQAPRATNKPLRDVRGFWRILLAVIAPLPMIAKGIHYLLSPVGGDTNFRDTVAAYEAHRSLVINLRWFDAVFLLLLIPAIYAVAWVSRRGAPRLTTAGAFISLLGCLAGFGLTGGVATPELLTVMNNLDVDTMSRIYDAAQTDPIGGIAGLLFIIGIVFGLGLLGAALWRSRAVPAWMGIAIMVGGITHPFIPHQIGQGIGLFIAAAGFAGATLVLLRQSNDDFDLPHCGRPAELTTPLPLAGHSHSARRGHSVVGAEDGSAALAWQRGTGLRSIEICLACSQVSASTVWKSCTRPASTQPRRAGPTWTQFLAVQAKAILACDFLHVDTISRATSEPWGRPSWPNPASPTMRSTRSRTGCGPRLPESTHRPMRTKTGFGRSSPRSSATACDPGTGGRTGAATASRPRGIYPPESRNNTASPTDVNEAPTPSVDRAAD